MLVNHQVPLGEHRHNYVRLGFLLGTIALFIAYIIINQVFEEGNSHFASNHSGHSNYSSHSNGTWQAGYLVYNDITPASWADRSLNALNYIWQLSWLFYALTFIYRRSSGGYLYLAPNTLTPTFYIVFTSGTLVQSIWLLIFHRHYSGYAWVPYFISFLLLSLALFIVNNNLALNKKLYETEGFDRDVWFLRFFAQNGLAFFACWTAIRFVLNFDTFLQLNVHLSVTNAGTIALILLALIAGGYFFGPNLNAALVEQCAYQFAPWIVFIIFFWGVVENNWIPKNVPRNTILATIEFVATVICAVVALALFTLRYRASKVDAIA